MWGRVLTAAASGVSASLPSIRPASLAPLPLRLSAGRLARLAPSAVVLTASETTILATFSPTPPPSYLLVDFRAKAAAVGIIPGTWARREMQPALQETLVARLIDRALRPALGGGVPAQLTVSVLSSARIPSMAVDVLAVNAAAAAVGAAGVPWKGPVAAARAALVEGEVVTFPSEEQVRRCALSVFVAVNDKGRVLSMTVEAGRGCVPEAEVMRVVREAVGAAAVLVPLQREFFDKVRVMRDVEGASAFPRQMPVDAARGHAVEEEVDAEVLAEVYEHAKRVYGEAFIDCRRYPGKAHRAAVVTKAQQDVIDAFPQLPMDTVLAQVGRASKEVYTALVLRDGLRMDGRGLDEVRLVRCETGVLPGEVHGSSLFERGDTQVLACATIGLKSQALRSEEYLAGNGRKSFFVHYSFPPYATGESGRFAGHTSRREVGHSGLAEQAIRPLLNFSAQSAHGKPGSLALGLNSSDEDSYPFALRVSAEVMASDGSSSMATVCAGSLALMNAGAPLQTAVAGVAMGLVTGPKFNSGDEEDYSILTDILGAEDHFGVMDMKVTGTTTGVTSCQLDVKLDEGLPPSLIERAFVKAGEARRSILDIMAASCPERRRDTPKHAPRVVSLPVDSGLVIKTLMRDRAAGLREIADSTGTHLSFEGRDDMIIIEAPSQTALDAARSMILKALGDLEIGTSVVATIKEVRPSFALLEGVSGNVSGILHVSKMQLNPVTRGGGRTDPASESSDEDGAQLRSLRYPDARHHFSKGDVVEVVVLESDRLRNVLRFGLKSVRSRPRAEKLDNEINSILAAVQQGS